MGGWIITRKTLILKGGWVGTLHKNHVGNRVVWQKKWNPGVLDLWGDAISPLSVNQLLICYLCYLKGSPFFILTNQRSAHERLFITDLSWVFLSRIPMTILSFISEFLTLQIHNVLLFFSILSRMHQCSVLLTDYRRKTYISCR